MKNLLTSFCILATAFLAWGETFEDSDSKLSIESPEGFTKLPQDAPENEFLGKIKAIFLAPDVQTSSGVLLIHHMTRPADSTDHAAFKKNLEPGVKSYFGEGYKLIKQEDVKDVKDRETFYVEYNCKGGENGPDPNGTIPLRVRWYLIKDGDNKYVGLIYYSREESWKEMEPKFVKSFKTAKIGK
jgi:hypothetical protein